MQSENNFLSEVPQSGLKQVKVDNWGTFFLQRLQQLYFEEQLLDLTIKFPTSDITVQAHRLVITTCTDYFTLLEQQQSQNNELYDGILIMPPDMPYECVKSIISFMYTGQLEYWTSEQNALYRTAEKMKMTVLTKLLDAQSYTSNAQANVQPNENTSPVTGSYKENARVRKTISSDNCTLPSQTLPGRKLPIWKRKLDTSTELTPANYDFSSFRATSLNQKVETTSGPSRFDLPEVEDYALGVFSSFDDITYDTKPIVQAPENSNSASNINENIDEDNSRKFNNSDSEHRQRNSNDCSDDEWTGPKSIMKHQDEESSSSKKVRFDFEEKENIDKTQCVSAPSSPADSINNHAKIIKEVLKKYPHLVKNNKNIRLKIMQKESKSSKPSVSAKTKVSYVVLKSDHLMGDKNAADTRTENADGCESGPWKCSKCDLEEEYTNYYMYRRHMQDVHEQKFDPRVCEHCGYKATKRNILMYHLYTKHNVPPPKNMCFPKCHACSYVALSETLLVRHQINHKHRPSSLSQLASSEGIQCMQCLQTFRDVAELASHEISTGHGSSNSDNKDKTHRCPHCGKTFVRITNLHVHLDCTHKDLRDSFGSQVPLKPSTEAEALSNVVSGIATSLGVNDTEQSEDVSADTEYIVPEVDGTSNTQEFQGDQMLMLIEGDYDHHETVEQGAEGDMIVYIQENDVQNKQGYDAYHSIDIAPCQEEIVEEVVEELEELEEEVMETESEMLNEQSDSRLEEEIQYVEEETEIVEYNEETENGQSSDNIDAQESIMIIEEEEEEVEEEEEQEEEQEEQFEDENDKESYREKLITSEWDVDKTIA